jgi:hypothetical protein
MITPKPDPWCCRAVQLAASMLPAAQRQRYALEFIAELYGMPRSLQVRHSLQVLASAWRLRTALVESGQPHVEEDPIMTKPKRPLRCRMGRHRWHSASAEDGERYECCLRCGWDRTESVGGSHRLGFAAMG